MNNIDIKKQLDQQNKLISALSGRIKALENPPKTLAQNIPTYDILRVYKLYAGLPVFTANRLDIPKQGEIYSKNIGGARQICVYISGVEYCVPIGLGVVSSDRAVAQTVAKALAAFPVGASDSSFIISANVLITTSTTFSFTVTCSYTDEGGTARVLTLNFSQITGTLVQTITNILGAGAYEGVPLHIRAKAGTTITIASAAGGTYTTVTYNIEGVINQIR